MLTTVRILLPIVLASCVVRGEADPEIEQIDLIGLDPSGEIVSGDTLQISIKGTELWKRAVTIEVHRVTGSTTDIVDTISATFDEEKKEQTATTDWIAGGDFLARGGRYELFMVARYREVSARSASFFMEVDPKLTAIDLVDLDPGETIEVGSRLRVRVTGTEVRSQNVRLELIREGARIATATVAFDDADPSHAVHEWNIDGNDRAGRSELFVRAVLGEQSIDSEEVFVEVVTAISAVEVYANGEKRELEQVIAFPATINVVVLGTGLLDLEVTVDMFRVSPEVIESSVVRTAESGRLEVTFTPEQAIFSGDDRVPLYFRARASGTEGNSPVVFLDSWGIDRCVWFGNGQELAHESEVANGTEVELRAFTWGFEGRSAGFTIFENDDIGDDFIMNLSGTVANEYVSPSWTAIFTEDGVLDRQSEYFFEVAIENRECQSPRLHVDQ